MNLVILLSQKRLKYFKIKFCDWEIVEIYRSREKLYDLYGERQWNHDPVFLNRVRNFSKIFKNVSVQAKSIYIKDKILNSEDKIKATWDVLSSFTENLGLSMDL